MTLIKNFFKDLFTAVIIVTPIAHFFFGSATNGHQYLLSTSIISYKEESVIINALASSYPYILGLLILCFTCYVMFIVKVWRNGENNWNSFILIAWATFTIAVIHEMAQPISWLGIAFCLFFLFFLVWIFIKYLYFCITEG